MLILSGFILWFGSNGCSRKDNVAPILILATNSDFGTYTAEILKAEGFNEFELDSLVSGRVTSSLMSRYYLVILAESDINMNHKNVIERFVKNGGNLIAICPNPSIAELFGIIPGDGKISEGYISIDTSALYGKGLTSKGIQFHGTAPRYKLNGGKQAAILISGKNDSEGSPAVVSYNFGKGHTIAFLYNIPKSIAYTRQGNPLFAGAEKDSIPGIRSMDMFTEGWLDTSNSIINQADEQMALFSHCIEIIHSHTGPLPRFWYFPDTLQCLVTLTNDGEFMNESEH